jgi:hypothetical protein
MYRILFIIVYYFFKLNLLYTFFCSLKPPYIGNHDDFAAHMTLVKMGRELCRTLHHIPQGAYLPLQDTSFGEQRIEALHLCRMTAEKEEDGFYIRAASLSNNYQLIPMDTVLRDVIAKTASPESKNVIIIRGLPGAGLVRVMNRVFTILYQ